MARATKKTRASAKAGGTGGPKDPFDRPTDPLFVPPPEALAEALTENVAAGSEYAAILESICGAEDDSQPVEQYDGTLGVSQAFVNTHQSAVCQVQWNDNLGSIYSNPGNVSGVRWGTGMMISDDIMLTCGHLFDQTGGGWQRPRENGTSNIISPEEIATNMKVNFNYQVDPSGDLRAEQSFAITELIEYRLGGVDMAICRVAGNPGATFGTGAISTSDATDGQMICIMGHPAGQPKRIEAGPVFGISGNQIRYDDIDTLGGNSGSAVLRESDGRIVGVHTNGGCNSVGFNFGMRIEGIIGVSPFLQNFTSPKLKVTDDPITLKFRDDKPTLKFRDDKPPTLKFRDDKPTLKFSDDGGGRPTLKFRDDKPPTLKFRDDKPPTLKFRDDKPPTLKFSDDGGGRPTLKFRDDGPSHKAIDDRKQPALDKNPALDNKHPAADGFGRGRFGGSGPRPFVLSTPHHSSAWEQAMHGHGVPTTEEEMAELEAEIAQVEEAMAEAEAQLQELGEYYEELIATYEAAYSDQ